MELFAKLKANPELIDQEVSRINSPNGKYLYELNPEELPISNIESGFPSLDEFFLLKKNEGELVVLAARPSIGKSALAFGIALNVSLKHHVHVFSLEMSHASIGRRLIANKLRCTISDIQRGRVNNRLVDGIAQLEPYKFFLDERSGLSIDEIVDEARRQHKRANTQLIVIDFIQIIGWPPGHSRALEIAEGMTKLKSLGKELRCPILLLSQLNRESEKRGSGSGNYKPMLSDLKESGAIEEAADIVIGLHREVHTGLRPTEADVLFLKNRNGPVGDVVLDFNAATSSFADKRAEEI